VNRSPERREGIIKAPHRGFVREIDIADNAHARIARMREAVELHWHKVWDMANRICSAQRRNNGATERAGSAGHNNMAAREINHGNFPIF
jgi:hypothetical protein